MYILILQTILFCFIQLITGSTLESSYIASYDQLLTAFHFLSLTGTPPLYFPPFLFSRLLQAAGGYANKCIALDVPATTLKLRLADVDSLHNNNSSTPESAPAPSVEGDDGDFYSHTALRSLERRADAIRTTLAATAALYPACLLTLSDTLPAATLAEAAGRFLAQEPASAAPRRPARTVLLGPRGAGKSRAARALSAATGAVHVSVGQLLESEAAAGTRAAAAAAPYVAMGEMVPDDIVAPLVLARLQRSDCQQRGWVLEGFPRTLRQATLLAKAKVLPSRCVVLEADDKTCLDRVTALRYDPVTGDSYNLKTSASLPAAAVVKRLQQRAEDAEPVVRSLINNYRSSIGPVANAYKAIITQIDTSAKSPAEVADEVAAFVAAPLRAGAASGAVAAATAPAQ